MTPAETPAHTPHPPQGPPGPRPQTTDPGPSPRTLPRAPRTPAPAPHAHFTGSCKPRPAPCTHPRAPRHPAAPDTRPRGPVRHQYLRLGGAAAWGSRDPAPRTRTPGLQSPQGGAAGARLRGGRVRPTERALRAGPRAWLGAAARESPRASSHLRQRPPTALSQPRRRPLPARVTRPLVLRGPASGAAT